METPLDTWTNSTGGCHEQETACRTHSVSRKGHRVDVRRRYRPACAVALGASGDLDPEFADVGRLGPIPEFKGPAWSLEALDDESLLMGGGDS